MSGPVPLSAAQVCLLDAVLKEAGVAACPDCHAEAQPIIHQPAHLLRAGVRLAFPCGHQFTAAEETLREAEASMVQASAMYYGWGQTHPGAR